MRIVIDLQGAQSESRYRGIGRYSLSFTKALVKNRGDHDVILALNGMLPDTIEWLRAEFGDILPQEKIRVWHAVEPVREDISSNHNRRAIAENIRETFLSSLAPDIVHISSLFEGYVDDSVTSIGSQNGRYQVSCMLYDLIPLLNPEQYLEPIPSYRAFYERKLRQLNNADLIFSISSYTKQEGIENLGSLKGDIVNISTAIDAKFRQLCLDETEVAAITLKFGLKSSFVLCTGDADERKNLPRLIQAYARLPLALREKYQLVLAGKISKEVVYRLKGIAKEYSLGADELIFTGYISDEELIQLYNLCSLYIFPSWHEGFGLPALEAMACGAAVIAANTSSLPEVVGLEEALFDPFSVDHILQHLVHTLEDDVYRERLRTHGLTQAKKFSWDDTAKRAIAAWETLKANRCVTATHRLETERRPRLAYVSPMPPERTGIADYSAILLPALSQYYEIDLIVTQNHIEDRWSEKVNAIRSVEWFRANASKFDRVLYQIGNSPYHSHMLDLVEEVPGTVVLHDFFLSGLLSWLEPGTHAWTQALYDSHGYKAVGSRFRNIDEAAREFPANWRVVQNARGVIVHSECSLSLARKWYGDTTGVNWRRIPLVRSSVERLSRQRARDELKINQDAFVVCSFGFLDETKLNHRLLKVWLESPLGEDRNAFLYFVGESANEHYRAQLLARISGHNMKDRVKVTGFTSKSEYEYFLSAADVAVQLRTNSRGETSAAVLDCMNYSLPVIANANGSMAELDPQAVWLLPDDFSDAELFEALNDLWQDPDLRHRTGQSAKDALSALHTPATCAKGYAEAIEDFYFSSTRTLPDLVRAFATDKTINPREANLWHLSQVLATNFPLPRPAKRFFLDITATIGHDLKTGIERVARALTMTLLEVPPAGYRIEPIYLAENNGVWQHKYARKYTLNALSCPSGVLDDEPVDVQNGDVMLILDISGSALVNAARQGVFSFYRNLGVAVYSVVYDLLPITMPNVFPPGATATHEEWVDTITGFDGAICISQSVAEDLKAWLKERGEESSNRRPYRVDWWHLGADVDNSLPSMGLPKDAQQVLHGLQTQPTFLMVGTIEPRKAHLQVIEAFELLWAEGQTINLVIIGKEGWGGLPDADRRNIPLTIKRISRHPELGSKLKWLEGASDEYLTRVYEASSCLIAASYGEGFGLPLIEAAQHKLPIVARDIPVFREVAGEHAYYFDASTPDQLADAIRDWLRLYDADAHPRSDNMPWLTWKESAAQLLSIVLNDKHEAASVATNS